jgi:hypothetical protein
MSQVFSFRLDKNNPREAQAMQVIETWASRGFALRYVLVEALLAYAEKELKQVDFSTALDQIITLLQELQVEPNSGNGMNIHDKRLSEPFLNAIAKATRPGFRAD